VALIGSLVRDDADDLADERTAPAALAGPPRGVPATVDKRDRAELEQGARIRRCGVARGAIRLGLRRRDPLDRSGSDVAVVCPVREREVRVHLVDPVAGVRHAHLRDPDQRIDAVPDRVLERGLGSVQLGLLGVEDDDVSWLSIDEPDLVRVGRRIGTRPAGDVSRGRDGSLWAARRCEGRRRDKHARPAGRRCPSKQIPSQ